MGKWLAVLCNLALNIKDFKLNPIINLALDQRDYFLEIDKL